MDTAEFRSLRISLASPEQILSWSYGEVTKPETINYRRLRPEKDGLFCEAIFGPQRDWQCYCGKYKSIRYKGIVCDKCNVEITRSLVRRERLGHIILAAPVAHIWYTRRVPSYMGMLLNVSRRNLDRVLYFAQYVTTFVDNDARERALKRLEKELEGAELKIASVIESESNEASAEAQARLMALREEIEQLTETFDERLATETDGYVQDAQRIELLLNNSMNEAVGEDMLIGDVTIIKKGETASNANVVLVQEATAERIGQLEESLSGERFSTEAALKQEIDGLAEEVGRFRQEVKDKYGSYYDRIRLQAQTSREQLEGLEVGELLLESEYREFKSKFGNVFRAAMGAEAFFEILQGMNLNELSRELWREVRTTRSKQKRHRATRRLRVVENLRQSGNRPEWMILTVLPVIPPDLRPMVQLDGGRFATSDLNDLYRRVINRNNRLKRLLDLGAPDVIVRNEKRMLQESVDSLIDNSQRGKALSRRGRRELKSLSDMLKGKKGRFRRNLLGKRVDYSGRSVIVCGPKLKMGECGLPKTMALELFRPFVIGKLIEYGHASNVKGAKRVIERMPPEVWAALEEVTENHPIMLNRAPTLHRLGIQAFYPKLIEGKAIQLHPLVCSAFNADFDGDQMAVHLPLSARAIKEAKELMLATNNLLKPADGQPIVGPSKDMVLGGYFLTLIADGLKGEGKVFSSLDEVEMALEQNYVALHARIKLGIPTYYEDEAGSIRYEDGKPRLRIIETTPGRVVFNRHLPKEIRFVNRLMDKGGINSLLNEAYPIIGKRAAIQMADDIKNVGFKYATISGVTIAVSDLNVPAKRQVILDDAQKRVDMIDRNYRRGLLTEDEQYQRTVDVWNKAKEEVELAVREVMDLGSPISIMALSGSTKGGFGPITQLAGMRGMMADPQGRIIPVPIKSNFRDGLSAQEYFISTHGSRKGLADTALRTADAGYLTRRLVDVAQDMIIRAKDCGTTRGIIVRRVDNFGKQTFSERIYGRFSTVPVIDTETGEMIANIGELIDQKMADRIDAIGVDQTTVFSPMMCDIQAGVCAKCYGLDLGSDAPVEMGVAVGIIAAQSIGEPGTQLTLRTFHTGGTASASGDITTGLPRVEELFEARQKPKGEAVISEIGGKVETYIADGVRHVLVIENKTLVEHYEVPADWTLAVENGQKVEPGNIIAELDDEVLPVKSEGVVVIDDDGVRVERESVDERDYEIPAGMRLLVGDGDTLYAGQQLTEGSKNPHQILAIQGRDALTTYMLQEIQEVYRTQGQNINDKHFETIIRKMLSRAQVTASGDTELLQGELIEMTDFQRLNQEIIEEGGEPAHAEPVLLGITKASLNTNSFLSASSFQHTIRVLAGAAIAGKEDPLVGLKENVIIGKLIPAGTGYVHDEVEEVEDASIDFEDEELGLSSILIDDNTDEALLEAIAAAAAEKDNSVSTANLDSAETE